MTKAELDKIASKFLEENPHLPSYCVQKTNTTYKIGEDVYVKYGGSWGLTSSEGVKNPERHGIPKTLGRRWTR